jgi:ribonuclease HII
MQKKYIVGIDEVGRGPVAGPVSIGVVLIDSTYDLMGGFAGTGLNDSKQMSPSARERVHALAVELRRDGALQFGVYSVTASQIDLRGITHALETAIANGLSDLAVDHTLSEVLLDGRLRAPRQFVQKSIIGGDESELVISLASVVAKVERDAYMAGTAHRKYPQYGFDSHKGYGTEAHLAAIREHGLTPIHRSSFLKNIVVESSHERSTKR